MSDFKCLYWGTAMVQGNDLDIQIFKDNIQQVKDENKLLLEFAKEAIKLNETCTGAQDDLDALEVRLISEEFEESQTYKQVAKLLEQEND